MKQCYALALLFFAGISLASGKDIPANNLLAFKDSIAMEADLTVNANSEEERMSASYRLIGQLKQFIRTPLSYSFALNDISGMIEVRQENDEFRILTWQVERDNFSYRYFGVIQFKADTGRFVPLIDYSDLYKRPEAVVTTPDKWMGMAYYGIKTVKQGKKSFYTLFGYDGNNEFSARKYIDVMWWDKDTLRFGAPIFVLPGQNISPNRFVLEYNKDASTSLNYNAVENKIMYDHLTSLEGEPNNAASFVPDGTYEGFVWKKGKWVHIDMIDYQKLEDGQAPMTNPTKKVSDDLSPHK